MKLGIIMMMMMMIIIVFVDYNCSQNATTEPTSCLCMVFTAWNADAV